MTSKYDESIRKFAVEVATKCTADFDLIVVYADRIRSYIQTGSIPDGVIKDFSYKSAAANHLSARECINEIVKNWVRGDGLILGPIGSVLPDTLITNLLNKKAADQKRCTGQTTRLVDKYVQDLFLIGEITVKDHTHNGDDRTSNEIVFERVVNRLNSEHGYGRIPGKKILANKSDLTIKINHE